MTLNPFAPNPYTKADFPIFQAIAGIIAFATRDLSSKERMGIE
jgi:hypothetical protein